MARLPVVRFRFTTSDRERYGSDWWEFDEAALSGLRARELMALDDELRDGLGLNVVTAQAAFRRGDTRGSLAVMWLARRLGGVDERLVDFDPLVMLAEVELVAPAAGDVDPPAPASSPSPESEGV